MTYRRTIQAALALILAAGAAGAADLPAPLTDADYLPVSRVEADLGRWLFYDPILSGNRNISCATCHHPRFATGDGVSLSLGEGGIGLGPDRRPDPLNPPEQRIPRNAPALFNMGAREMRALFHDGRIERDPSRKAGFRTPLEEDMEDGFSGILSAQTMFPVLSQDEMAGHYSENDISTAVRRGRITGPGGAWDLIAARVAAIPGYADAFAAAYPDTAERGIAFTDISNAVAAFMALEWRSDQSPFDAHLRGQAALTGAAADGMALFYGAAGCSACHSGPLQTDHGFHAMGQPQIGPGKAARFERHARDEGRMRVTGRAEDRFAFRTPSLRNVMQTGPWGHAGAYADLRVFLAAHQRPGHALASYDRALAVLPDLAGAQDWRVLDDAAETAAITAAAAPDGPELSGPQIDMLLAFLAMLSDPVALSGRLGIPDAVPSELPIDR
ncbi:MAG: cytochrome-c peroxidase [Rhodobacteraceae bacterium]|nr:cytochrome-c peroxidase [Paracoccaceae bacterium]